MTRVVYYMTEAKTFLGGLTGWNGLINKGLAKVAAFRTAAPAKLREAATYLQKQLLDTPRAGMTRIQREGTKNHKPHVVKQDKQVPPTGKLKGEDIPLDGFKARPISYTKRSMEDTRTLRNEFNSGKRQDFLKGLDETDLRNAGFSDADIAKIGSGGVPDGYQVHHKLPLDDGGTNDPSNLVFIKNDPFHKSVTNLQNSLTKGMQPGDTRQLDWPVFDGPIYRP